MHTCPWCTTSYVNWQSQCSQCGGPLAPPIGQGLGDPPPPTPRKVPAAYVRRVRWSGNFTAWVGLGITGLSSIIALPMFVHGKWQAYMPALFAVGGVALFAKAMRAANGRLRAYRIGKAVEGRVRQVRVDSAVLINGQQPYRVIYHYPVGARMEEGNVLSCDPMAMRCAAGQPIWVLYDEAAPEDHAIFPPLL